MIPNIELEKEDKQVMIKKRNKEGIMSLVMAFAMSLSVLGGVTTSILQVKAAANVSNPRITEDGTVTWDKITFGSYYQDAEFMPEPIKWRILDIDESGNAFLLADKALDCKPYNNEYTSCTWETCTLRDWLNGTDTYESDDTAFIKAAFTDEERNAIIDTTVVNDDSPSYGTEGGKDTTDKIYLLSMEEASNTLYGFDEFDKVDCMARRAKATDYAFINGAFCNYSVNTRGCNWWLRSLGQNTQYCAQHVQVGGVGVNGGSLVHYDTFAVRPALRVNLSSSCVNDAGSVTSEGIETAGTNRSGSNYNKPYIDSSPNPVTTWDCVYFGSYKQKATFEKMPIEWRVLSVNNNDAFVVADKDLDCKSFNTEFASCTWETCTLRDWLNGTNAYESDDTAFIKAAFTDEERKAILDTTVVNDDNPSYGTEGGKDTTDKIYLLSMEEASNTSYGFDGLYNMYIIDQGEVKTRQTKATDYARMNGLYCFNYSDYAGNWWLRSSGHDTNYASLVWNGGDISDTSVNLTSTGVRPTLHVNLLASCVELADTVSSESHIIELKKADEVSALISEIATVTKDSKTSIDSARRAYDALSEGVKPFVNNYYVLQNAEEKYAELTKSGSSNGNDNVSDNNGNGVSNNSDNAGKTKGGNTNNISDGSASSNTGTTPATTEAPASTETVSTTPVTTETPNDNLTTFNIKNKKTYKKSQKVKIKDEDGIKSVVLNTKKIKIKKGKKSVSFKLSSYKKSLKKKNKWNKIIVTDVNGNKNTIQFKIK